VYLSVKTAVIDRHIRIPLFIIFSGITALSLLVFLLMVWRDRIMRRRFGAWSASETEMRATFQQMKGILSNVFQLMKSKHMALFAVLFVYLGRASSSSVDRTELELHLVRRSLAHILRRGLRHVHRSQCSIRRFKSDHTCSFRPCLAVDDRKRLIGLHGLLLGTGEILGQ
jgi:hypothetical protein